MTDNLSLWDKLSKTDPKHTSTFRRAGGFAGTAIKPIYTTLKLTEALGPAGKGWGMGEPMFQVVPGHNGEVMVYCWVSLWWGEERNTVYGVGGDKVTAAFKSGLHNDDEAFKKAFTDAVGNAMKHLGMSADVHMGRFDDSKYVSERRREEEAANGHEATREAFVASTREPPPDAPADAPKGKYKYGDMRVADMRPLWEEMRNELDRATSLKELGEIWYAPAFQTELKKLKPDWQTLLAEHKDRAKDIFLKALPAAATLGEHLDALEAEGRDAG